MEGALRKLGVDPDTIVGNHASSEEDQAMLDPDLCTPFNVVAVPATNTTSETEDDPASLHSAERTAQMGRLRHLDILEEVRLATGSKIM